MASEQETSSQGALPRDPVGVLFALEQKTKPNQGFSLQGSEIIVALRKTIQPLSLQLPGLLCAPQGRRGGHCLVSFRVAGTRVSLSTVFLPWFLAQCHGPIYTGQTKPLWAGLCRVNPAFPAVLAQGQIHGDAAQEALPRKE